MFPFLMYNVEKLRGGLVGMKRLEYLDSAKVEDLDMIELLEKLRRRLNDSRTEMYCGLKSMKGTDCAFVKRALEKFEKYDLDDIIDLVSEANRRLNKYGR